MQALYEHVETGKVKTTVTEPKIAQMTGASLDKTSNDVEAKYTKWQGDMQVALESIKQKHQLAAFDAYQQQQIAMQQEQQQQQQKQLAQMNQPRGFP